jgi:hypothetical protein
MHFSKEYQANVLDGKRFSAARGRSGRLAFISGRRRVLSLDNTGFPL